MAEKNLAWRQKSIRRSMVVIRYNAEEKQRLKDVLNSQSKHQRLSDLKKSHLLEDYKLQRKRPCGVCEVIFSEICLPVSVTNKAVYDLRHTWLMRDAARQMAQRQKEIEFALKTQKKEKTKAIDFASIVSTQRTAEFAGERMTALTEKQMISKNNDTGSTPGNLKERENMKRISAICLNSSANLSVTRAYDATKICCFCAQFFDQSEVFRPSFDASLSRLLRAKEAREIAEERGLSDPLKDHGNEIVLDKTSTKFRKRLLRRTQSSVEEGVTRGQINPSSNILVRQRQHKVAPTKTTFFIATGGHSHKHDGQALQKQQISDDSSSEGTNTYSRMKQFHKSRFKVRGHSTQKSAALNLDDENEQKEIGMYEEQARSSAFWHAKATDTLMKSPSSFSRFRRSNRARPVEIRSEK
jgi:hypothetical protein